MTIMAAEKPLTDAQRAFLRQEAESAARVLATADESQLDTLLAAELLPHMPLVLGIKMISGERGWTQEQFYKGVLYASLRQRRAVRESEEI
jgi:hypothetical protein